MHMLTLYRQFAVDCRRLAATLTEPADKQALEVFATAWDKAAESREAFLSAAKGGHSSLNQPTSD